MALFRALETVRPASRRLFEDRYARRFLPVSLRVVVGAARIPLVGRVVPWFIDLRWPGARTSGVARTRFIDDLVRARLEAGVEQLVLLGAGFDSRALRIERLEDARVFELDRPPTLEEKRERLGDSPAHVTYVPTDFNREGLAEVLTRAGFDAGARTLFVWEGVTNYLTAEAVDRTLRDVSELGGPGSEIAFTYVHRDVIRDPAAFAGGRRTASKVASSGEPWTFGLDPGELAAYLRARGLALVEDVGSLEYRAELLGSSRRTLRGYAFYRVAVAAREEVAHAARH
jgi:methyltransferase (TIGR00027 family)